MKKMILIFLMSLVGFNASGYYAADQEYPVFQCSLLKPYPDTGLSVQVIEGNAEGGTRLDIAESLISGVKKYSVIVKETPVNSGAKYSRVVYKGKNIILVINLVDVDDQGTKHGALIVGEKGQRTEKLKCIMPMRIL